MYICTCTCTSRASTELCEFIYFKIVMIFRCSILPFARHLDIFPRLNLPKNSVFQVSLSAENAISKHFRESKMQLFTGALPLDTAWGGAYSAPLVPTADHSLTTLSQCPLRSRLKQGRINHDG